MCGDVNHHTRDCHPLVSRPTSKLGCLGSSAGGSEGLATPCAASVRGPGQGGPHPHWQSQAGAILAGSCCLTGWLHPHLHGWIQRNLAVPSDLSGSCQLGWRPQSHPVTLPKTVSQKSLSLASHWETSEVAGVLLLIYKE